MGNSHVTTAFIIQPQPTAKPWATPRMRAGKISRDQHPVDGAGLLGEHEEGHEDEDQPRQIRRNLGRNTPVGQRVGTDAESENEGEGEQGQGDARFLVDADVAASKLRHEVQAKSRADARDGPRNDVQGDGVGGAEAAAARILGR